MGEITNRVLKEDWPEFCRRARVSKPFEGFSADRIRHGETQYGDTNFDRKFARLIIDGQEECSDLAVYAMMMWRTTHDQKVRNEMEMVARLAYHAFHRLATVKGKIHVCKEC